MKISTIAFVLLAIPSASFAEPFGINQGDEISKLKVLSQRSIKTFRIEVPVPNSNFEDYGVVATPVHGVCAVYAQTQIFSTWPDAKAKRDSLAKLLAKYGNPVHVRTDSGIETLFTRPGVDAYDLEWRKIPAPLSTISLDVIGSKQGQVVRLTYFYRNMAQCHNWEPKQDARGI